MDYFAFVTDAKYVKDYILDLTFSDGIKKTVDFIDIIKKEPQIYAPLLDVEVFKDFRLDGFTIMWLDKVIEISPEFLYNY